MVTQEDVNDYLDMMMETGMNESGKAIEDVQCRFEISKEKATKFVSGWRYKGTGKGII